MRQVGGEVLSELMEEGVLGGRAATSMLSLEGKRDMNR